jgi:hypothetical protein
VTAGYVAYRYGWLYRSPRIGYAPGGYACQRPYLPQRLVTAADVRQRHDLILATVLLFAGGIAISVGYFCRRPSPIASSP